MGSNKLKQHDEPCLLYSGKIDTEQPYVLSIWKTRQILFFMIICWWCPSTAMPVVSRLTCLKLTSISIVGNSEITTDPQLPQELLLEWWPAFSPAHFCELWHFLKVCRPIRILISGNWSRRKLRSIIESQWTGNGGMNWANSRIQIKGQKEAITCTMAMVNRLR